MFLLKLSPLINVVSSILFLVDKTSDLSDTFLTFNTLGLLLLIKFRRRESLNIVSFTKTQVVLTLFSILDLIIFI